MASQSDLESSSVVIFSLGDFSRHVGKCVEGFESVHQGNGIKKRNLEDCWSYVMKKSCA